MYGVHVYVYVYVYVCVGRGGSSIFLTSRQFPDNVCVDMCMKDVCVMCMKDVCVMCMKDMCFSGKL